MLITDPKSLNFSDYDRLFTIGCSFTHWCWPTWADIIAKEYEHLEYHNYGQPGCGNSYILTMLSQLDRSYKFNEKDLVLIMFSSWHRISTYNCYRGDIDLQNAIINDTSLAEVEKSTYNWQSGTDLIAQQLLENTTTNCDRGYAVQNYAIIDSISTILSKSAYTGAYMQSVSPKNQGLFDTTAPNTYKDDVHELYKGLDSQALGVSLYDFFDHKLNDHVWGNGDEDYHPYPSHYCNYLKGIGFDISESTENWSKFADQIVKDSSSPEAMENMSSSWPYRKYNEKDFPL